jgi:autotransporter-associated beta strand protein
VKFDTIFDGTSYVSPSLHQVATHSTAFPSRLRMTGGTFDLNNEPRNQRLPIPEGTGLIINTGTNVQSGLILVADGQDHEFSGVIADGGPLVGDNNAAGPTPQGPGRQIGIVNIAAGINGGGGVWTLSGSNTYSGSTRLQFGSIKLARGGTIGFPTSNGLTGPLRIYGPSFLDLNGHNQTIALMQNGTADGKVFNSGVGTVSTLTFGYGNEQSPSRNASFQFMDNQGTGGVLALTKIGATCIQTLSGVNTYSGDTTVSEGTLAFATTTAVSPNSTFRLSSGAILVLNYTGDAPVRQLFIDGVQKPPGTYGAETAPITGSGTITVRSPKIWDNGWGGFAWDVFTPNWSSESVLWMDGDDAIFGASEVGTITLGSPILVRDQTFNAPGYTIAGGGTTMTLVGANPTITVNADATNAASLLGTNGLTIQGTGVLALKGDPAGSGNQYTGGTYVRSGTLLLGVQGASASGTSYAVDSIEALDAGATVKFDTTFNGTSYVSPAPHQIAAHATAFSSRLRMTGGTFDLNNEPRNQRIPVPEGTGLIINTGTNVQSGVIMVADGRDHEFSGVIADGGPLVGDNNAAGPTPQGPGRQIGIVSFGGQVNGGGGVWTLSGSNTYSGSTRIDQGASIKLARGGTIGFPTPNGLTGPLRIYGSADPRRGYLDLNGHNQTIALMQNGNADGKVFNSAPGTISTLTFGYGNEQNTGRNSSFQFMDNQGTGGILALRKIGATCIQTLSGVNTYSGDTTVSEGTLAFATTTAVSPNSTFRLSSGAPVALNYAGDAPVRQLFIDGVQKPRGTYGAETAPITGTGTITVVEDAPASLGFAFSDSTLSFSWQGAYKLQSATNNILGPWFDFPNGGTSPVNVTVDPSNGSVFFRLSN